MGWGSGNEIVGRVARVVSEQTMSKRARSAIYEELIDAALDMDADNLYELWEEVDEAFDDALRKLKVIDDEWVDDQKDPIEL